MTAFRFFLIAFLVALLAYSGVTIANHGANLFPAFFGDMAEMGWPGQFNFDFMGFLMLSAIWTAWRNDFSGGGLGLAVLAFFGGMMFLCIYLLVLSYQTGGDAREIMLRKTRAGS